MYNGRFQAKQPQQPQRPVRRRKCRSKKTRTLLFSLVLLLTMMIGGTLAYLTMKTDPIQNVFTPSHVSCFVEEDFDGTTKSNVNVRNDSDINAYIRVKLVTYRVNAANQHIGGIADLPTFTLGAGWVKHTDGYYYYTQPVAPGASPAANLTDSMTLTGVYNDADGGKQVVEVMAEAIQSVPTSAVVSAWNVDPSTLSTTGA